MASNQLMPCPFCGSSDLSLRTRATAILECMMCGAMFIKRSDAAAIEAWNTRTFRAAENVSSDYSASIQKPTPVD